MIIVWSGLGFVVVVIAGVCLFFTEYFLESMLHDENYYQAHGWPKLFALWLAAILTRAVSNYVSKKQGRVLIDKETGEEVTLKPKHSLFFINLEYWPYVFFMLGIAFFFIRD